jgi:hypothetical protein
MEDEMEKKIFRFALISLAAMLVLPFAFAAGTYPKTANCPIEGATAHATGHTRDAMKPGCTDVEYKHKGWDYSDPKFPQKFKHVFWVTQCSEQ